MAEHIINEKGYFWCAEREIPEKHFAPEDVVYGTFIIAADGSARIELSGLLDAGNRKISAFAASRPRRDILGRLITTDRSVFLVQADSVNLTMKTHNIDHEDYVCQHCFVSDCGPSELKQICASITTLKMHFGNFGDWLSANPIKVKRTKNTVYLTYKRPKESKFDLGNHQAVLSHVMHAPWSGTSHHSDVHIRNTATLRYEYLQAISGLDAVKAHRLFHDFLIVLSNQGVSITYPEISTRKSGFTATLYYQSFSKYQADFEIYRCWVTYPQISDKLPSILRSWMNGSDKFGPGFYLYLSTRRGHAQYYENRFMSLIGGLETLHRSAYAVDTEPAKTHVANKIIRFVNEHPEANSKTRKWIRKKLAYASEPALDLRLFEIIKRLPICLMEPSLRKFCKLCADARNDIAHFGKIMRAADDDEVIQKIHDLSDALDHLYHASILLLIGVEMEILRSVLGGEKRSWLVRKSLIAAGLVYAED